MIGGFPFSSEITQHHEGDDLVIRFRSAAERAGITRLADVTGLDDVDVPVYLAIRPFAKSLTVGIGKGMERSQARVAAMMEAIELWHAEEIDLPTRTLPWSAAGRPGTVNPGRLPAALNAEAGSPSGATEWIKGIDLVTGMRTWVPKLAVSMDFVDFDAHTCPVARNSNGLASGAVRDQAILHALDEVIERDAEWRWRNNDVSARVALNTVDDPRWRALSAKLSAAGLVCAVWDVTSEVGVPVFGSVVVPDPDHAPWRKVGAHDGFAAHPDPVKALLAAVTEAAQKRLTYISGSRDDLSRQELARANDQQLTAAVLAQLAEEPEVVDFRSVESLATNDYRSDVETVLTRLANIGYDQVVLVDLTREDLGVPVVKVLVPDMLGSVGASAPPALMSVAEEAGA
ncbi:hypothetical protein DMP23_19980 [Amycolatopsis sp. A1MSW2902]|uniref:YcaO-like family protein n=1 Tax=Amycolatopsis sp. A1MSW2902 TaxID=687413 RepID=UPI00307D84B0